jgi:hypothetical protein
MDFARREGRHTMVCLSFEIPLGGVSGLLALLLERWSAGAAKQRCEPCRHSALVSPWLITAAGCTDAAAGDAHLSAGGTCDRCRRSFSAAQLRALRRQEAERLRREFGF